ncbi:hypothetical protein PMZ80_006669 [Knufia obscura]|uniref:Uncharacterized protein n=1 Tax=Knufia obscura TaxID=1635080 RepID=A0ABR0RLB0_9EURO|nr:hypothetical protein PMZ80_006669 [Knufia obscura]
MMLLSLALCALVAPAAFAHPLEPSSKLSRRQQDIDVTVLQFALTLEHLENAFYKLALQTLTQQHFMDAGFGANYFNNIQLIAEDEDQHVQFLTSALMTAGAQPVAPCTYNFNITDVNSFIALSNVLEGVGTSAYLGGAPLITSKDILTAAGSILVTEALHTSLQRTALKAAPGPNPFGTPLDPNAVFTLAASFIVECPATNEPLPFKAFPALTSTAAACACEGPDCGPSFFQKRQVHSPPAEAALDCVEPLSRTIRSQAECVQSPAAPAQAGGNNQANPTGPAAELCRPPSAGTTVAFEAAQAVTAGSFFTFVSGLMIVSVTAQIHETMLTAMIPPGVAGQTYVMVTSSDLQGKFDAAAALFGPAVLEGKLAVSLM